MFKTRTITALAGIPLQIGVLYLGGIYWQGFITLLAIIALYEYFAMMADKGLKPVILPALFLMGVLLFRVSLSSYLAGLIFAGLFLMILALVITYPRFGFDDLLFSFFGAFYIGYLLSYALILIGFERSFSYILLVLIITWASDIGGYLFGRLWGSKKLAPQLSPGKTWEGAIGGIILTVVLLILYNHIVNIENLNLINILLLGITASVAAQVGDLLESGMKRYFGVKDSGHILPGHGGVLDRFDSFMLVLPVVYYFLVVIT